jgi:hypothetical protein
MNLRILFLHLVLFFSTMIQAQQVDTRQSILNAIAVGEERLRIIDSAKIFLIGSAPIQTIEVDLIVEKLKGAFQKLNTLKHSRMFQSDAFQCARLFEKVDLFFYRMYRAVIFDHAKRTSQNRKLSYDYGALRIEVALWRGEMVLSLLSAGAELGTSPLSGISSSCQLVNRAEFLRALLEVQGLIRQSQVGINGGFGIDNAYDQLREMNSIAQDHYQFQYFTFVPKLTVSLGSFTLIRKMILSSAFLYGERFGRGLAKAELPLHMLGGVTFAMSSANNILEQNSQKSNPLMTSNGISELLDSSLDLIDSDDRDNYNLLIIEAAAGRDLILNQIIMPEYRNLVADLRRKYAFVSRLIAKHGSFSIGRKRLIEKLKELKSRKEVLQSS